jgi:hypothetical protein
MQVGDRVCHDGDECGIILEILTPGTQAALDYGIPGGGILMQCDDIGLVVFEPHDFSKITCEPFSKVVE